MTRHTLQRRRVADQREEESRRRSAREAREAVLRPIVHLPTGELVVEEAEIQRISEPEEAA